VDFYIFESQLTQDNSKEARLIGSTSAFSSGTSLRHFIQLELFQIQRNKNPRKKITLSIILSIVFALLSALPQDTAYAPTFSKIWEEITTYLKDCPVLVAHNATFDMRCIRHALQLHHLPCPDIDYYCSLCAARHIYDFGC